jgi:hypothetical protein
MRSQKPHLNAGGRGLLLARLTSPNPTHFLVSDGYHLVVSAGGRYAINPQLKLTLGSVGFGKRSEFLECDAFCWSGMGDLPEVETSHAQWGISGV